MGFLLLVCFIVQQVLSIQKNIVPFFLRETFYVSLNEDIPGQEQWAEAKADMPTLTELTLCHWERLSYFSHQISSAWSYCVKISEALGGINCFQYDIQIDQKEHQGGKNINFHVEFQNSSEDVYVRMANYKERQWNHFCWRVDSNGSNVLFLNGDIEHKFNNPLVVIPSKDKSQSVFLIGQEQDTLRGHFNQDQAFRGRISGLNLWNYTLSDEIIKLISSCHEHLEGNVITWAVNDWTYINVDPKPMNSSDFCSKKKELFLFPFRTSLNEAHQICKVHGGNLFAPENELENNKLKQIVAPSLDKCDPKGKIFGSWLGVTKLDKHMVKITSNGTEPLFFTNWDKPPKPTQICVLFNKNGFWDLKSSFTCSLLKACPVCSFDKIPILSWKGTCFESNLDYYWYLAKDEKHGIFYDGYKGAKLYPSRDFRKWSSYMSGDGSFNYNIELRHGSGTPVGQRNWNVLDSSCNFDSREDNKVSLSLSTCVLGEHFTCNNGECISKYRRCDNVFDCMDHTDEDRCNAIVVPTMYDKSKHFNWSIMH